MSNNKNLQTIDLPVRQVTPTAGDVVDDLDENLEAAKKVTRQICCVAPIDIPLCTWLWCGWAIILIFILQCLWWLVKLPFFFIYYVTFRFCLDPVLAKAVSYWFCSTKCSCLIEDGCYDGCCCCDNSLTSAYNSV